MSSREQSVNYLCSARRVKAAEKIGVFIFILACNLIYKSSLNKVKEQFKGIFHHFSGTIHK